MTTSEPARAKPGRLMRSVQVLARLYDWNLGWLLGNRLLRLTHVGRRSGRRHRVMLEVIGIDRDAREVFVLAGFGRTSDWYRNIQTTPPAEVALGLARFRASSRVLDAAEAAAILADYERRQRPFGPVLRKALSWLIGWDYDGSERARRHLVRERPVVAFHPATQR